MASNGNSVQVLKIFCFYSSNVTPTVLCKMRPCKEYCLFIRWRELSLELRDYLTVLYLQTLVTLFLFDVCCCFFLFYHNSRRSRKLSSSIASPLECLRSAKNDVFFDEFCVEISNSMAEIPLLFSDISSVEFFAFICFFLLLSTFYTLKFKPVPKYEVCFDWIWVVGFVP